MAALARDPAAPDAPATHDPPAGPRIAVLPPELASQIAAGEVIERPASVVKELVENALDAGARRIEVEIEGGGLRLIRVTDDGSGMSPEEASLSIERHATSKLRSIADLSALLTMGFRGEALPSIAAVSRFTLTTRTAGALAATRLTLEAGRPTAPPREAGAQAGTQIEVADLLFNVPARLKFMKGEATEAGHVAESLLRLALGFPQVHVRLKSSGKVVLDLPAHRSALERAQAALGGRGRRLALYPAAGAEAGVEVEAYLGAPSETTNTPRNVYLLMNRRFIRDRTLLHSVTLGYGEILDRGRYPALVLHLRVPAAEVDVNVHPQKLEVRFVRPQEVYAAVRHVLREAVGRAPWLLPGTGQMDLGEGGRVYHLGGETEGEAGAAGEQRPGYGGPAGAPGPAPIGAEGGTGAAGGGLEEHRRRIQQALGVNLDLALSGARPPGGGLDPAGHRAGEAAARRFFSDMNFLGQFGRTYLLCEHDKELVLIDQHAAHERLAFERLRAARGVPGTGGGGGADVGRGVRSQRLLLPLTLELDPQRAALIEESQAELSALGFAVRPFGGRTFALDAVPDAAEFGRGARVYQDPERLLGKVLDDLLEHGRSDTVAARRERVLATIACHSVVRAGDVLDATRARALLAAMDEVEFFPYCPHGRPVLVRMPLTEIERRFGR